MTAQAFPAASLLCLGKSLRAGLMRKLSQATLAGHATEFQSGMHAVPAGEEQTLARDQFLSLDGRNLTLVCLAGEIWLTRDGDREDYILAPGQHFTVRPTDQVALQALRPSRLRLIAV